MPIPGFHRLEWRFLGFSASRFDLIFPWATAASRHDDRRRREKARQENPALLKRLDQLEAEQVSFKSEITAIPPDAVDEVVRLPAGTEIYRREVETVEPTLQDPGIRHEAIEILRSMMEWVVVTPTKERALRVELRRDVTRLITADEPISVCATKTTRAASDEAARCAVGGLREAAISNSSRKARDLIRYCLQFQCRCSDMLA